MKKYIHVSDQVTTILNWCTVGVCLILAVVMFTSGGTVFSSLGGVMENLPDGQGPGDGYIAIGQLAFAGIGALGGLVAYVLGFVLLGLFVLYLIFGMIYTYRRKQYQKTGDLLYIGKNLFMKLLINAVQLGLWIRYMAEEFKVYTVLILVFLIVIEGVLGYAYYLYNEKRA